MRKHYAVLITVIVASLACSTLDLTSGLPKPATATPVVKSTPVLPEAAAPSQGAVGAGLPSTGRLAVQGLDGNIYVLQKDTPPRQLSSDGIPLDDKLQGRVYLHPTWSPQGWLSFVRLDTTKPAVSQLDLMAIPPDSSTALTILGLADRTYIYGYWSPAACSAGEACGRFAYLIGENDQIALHLAEVTRDKVTAENAIGLASPFYFSWSPDGQQMLWHRNSTDLTIYDADTKQIGAHLPDTAGIFQSPAWSPSDNRLLFARIDHNANQITITQDNKRFDVGTAANQPVFFSWSPDGVYIASAQGNYPLTALTIARADGSASRPITVLDPVVAFFWSPDSTRLAVITVEDRQQSLPQAHSATRLARLTQQGSPDIDLLWSVVDVATGKTTRLASFLPTPEEFYILRYFDQYSQSHRVWSPDSRYIVYAEKSSSNILPAILLLDTLTPNAPAIELMKGNQAIYSFGE